MKIDTTSGDFDFTYLSLGAGVQSSALLVLSCTDDRVPKPDVAIFADTGDEPAYVYSYLKVLAEWAKPHGVEVVTATAGVLSEVTLKPGGFVGVPLHVLHHDGTSGMLRRQCTREFKIEPITKKVRELLGYQPRQRVKEQARCMIGISLDEAQRMKPSWHRWISNCWPLVDLGIKRNDCYEIIAKEGIPRPQKSACVYCPYRDDQSWEDMRLSDPEEFAKAVAFDNSIRNKTLKGDNKQAFVHRSCVPLGEAVFDANDPDQVDLFNNECEGMCGV